MLLANQQLIKQQSINEYKKYQSSFDLFYERAGGKERKDIFPTLVNEVSSHQALAYVLWTSIFRHATASLIVAPTNAYLTTCKSELFRMLDNFGSDLINAKVCVKQNTADRIQLFTDSKIVFNVDHPMCGRGMTLENLVLIAPISNEIFVNLAPAMAWNSNGVIFKA